MLVHQRTLLATAAILLVSCQITHAQFFSTRYSRSIGMGNAYTGVAEGIETTYSNDAGLAAIDFYGAAYSSGQGTFFAGDYSAYDLAVVAPLNPRIGTVAISYHATNMYDRWATYSQVSLLQAHFGRAFGEALAFGACLNYYRLADNSVVLNEENLVIDRAGRIHNAIDFGLSALYTTKDLLLPSWNDVLKAGIYVKNVLGAEWLDPTWFYRPYEAVLPQQFSLGASYRFSPIHGNATARDPVAFLLAAALHHDNGIRSRRYYYDAARTSLGFEVQLFELVQFRYGKENQRFLDGLKVDDLQHPVTRLGAGLLIPIGELIGVQSEYHLRLDYSHSTRENDDDLARMLLRSGYGEPQKDTFTLQLEFKP